MKLRASLAPILVALIASTLIAGCGGGNDQDAGSLTAFNISPATVSLGGEDANSCGAGFAARVYAFGGTGPYKVYNNNPAWVSVSKTLLDRPGDSFDVTALSTTICLAPATITVVDALGRQATFTLTTTRGTTTGGST